ISPSPFKCSISHRPYNNTSKPKTQQKQTEAKTKAATNSLTTGFAAAFLNSFYHFFKELITTIFHSGLIPRVKFFLIKVVYYNRSIHHKSTARRADIKHPLGILNDIFFLSINQIGRRKISTDAGCISQNLLRFGNIYLLKHINN